VTLKAAKRANRPLFRVSARVSTWFALFALVLQTLLPLGQMLQAAESDDTIFICTPNGIVSLSQASLNRAAGLPIPVNSDTRHGEANMAACQVCTAGLFGSGLLWPEITGPVPVNDPAILTSLDLLAWHGQPLRGALPPRGPPATV
jgi:hypothetical protein